MNAFRRFASDAPPATTFFDNKPTLVVSWWCTIYAIVFTLFRISGRYIRTEKLFREDKVVFGSILLLLIRMALAHVILLYGTNNAVSVGFSPQDIQQRQIGSQLVLASRIMYAAYLWALKYSVSLFLRKLTTQFWQKSHTKLLHFFHILLGVTFLAVVVSDLAECQPFNLYWQVVPDPGAKCRQGYGQLLTMGVTNIFTDVILVAFPIPLLLKSRLSTKRKINIMIPLALPLFSVAVNLYRLPAIIDHQGDQTFRTLMASIDLLVATMAVNAVVLSSLVQDKGYKKLRYKHIVDGDPFKGNASSKNPLKKQQGSDEDLMQYDDLEQNEPSIEMDRIRRPEQAKFPVIVVESRWEVDTTESDDTVPRKNEMGF